MVATVRLLPPCLLPPGANLIITSMTAETFNLTAQHSYLAAAHTCFRVIHLHGGTFKMTATFIDTYLSRHRTHHPFQPIQPSLQHVTTLFAGKDVVNLVD